MRGHILSTTGREDRRSDDLQPVENLVVRDADDPKSLFSERPLSLRIVRCPRRIVVDAPIDLDYQPSFVTVEVENVDAD